MPPETDMYDEDLDAPIAAPGGNEGEPEKDETEDVGEPFLAPKSAFKGDLSPGTVHRVRIEESHDSELQLVCLGEEAAAAPEPEPMPQDENAALYE